MPNSFEAQSVPSEWMLVVNASGHPLYWIAANGGKRPPSDPPPREDWHSEMQECEP